MYISENAVMMVGLGLMFLIAGFGGVFIGLLLTKFNTATRLVTAAPVPVPVPATHPGPLQSIRSGLTPGNWKSHVFKKVPYATIEEALGQLNARGLRIQSVTQADGDKFCTVYAEEWIPNRVGG